MGQIQKVHATDRTGYISDYVANIMNDLEATIQVITDRKPTPKTAELLYLIGMVKLAAYDAQGITPLPDFKIGATALTPRLSSELDDCTVLVCFPWNWAYDAVEGES